MEHLEVSSRTSCSKHLTREQVAQDLVLSTFECLLKSLKMEVLPPPCATQILVIDKNAFSL